jgi:hypothetical protein
MYHKVVWRRQETLVGFSLFVSPNAVERRTYESK